LKLKFQTVVEKTAKNFRGLLYLAAPGTCIVYHKGQQAVILQSFGAIKFTLVLWPSPK